MERATVDVYEERGAKWALQRKPVRAAHARQFAQMVRKDAIRCDMGCGAGRYMAQLGTPTIGLDAARSMLQMAKLADPARILVQADLESLPFANGSLAGAWANMSYLHIPKKRLPASLADLHRCLEVGAPLDLQVLAGDYEGDRLPQDDIGGRFFASWQPRDLERVLVGAGFDVSHTEASDVVRLSASRARTLPDVVGPDMRVMFVGLNPSLHSADNGVPYSGPRNRFWPAADSAGLTSAQGSDLLLTLRRDRIGFTDIVKRASSSASSISKAEYRQGMKRVLWLVRWLKPQVVCFVGLSGWQAVSGGRVKPGVQPVSFAGTPVYVMPSTSAANAAFSLDELTQHMSDLSRMVCRA